MKKIVLEFKDEKDFKKFTNSLQLAEEQAHNIGNSALENLMQDLHKQATNQPETVTIPKKEYDGLVKDSTWLMYVEGAGCDNCDAWSYAYELARADGFNPNPEEDEDD